MRHMVTVLGIVGIAILIGGVVYYFNPFSEKEVPSSNNVSASALRADAPEVIPFTVIAEGTNASEVSSRKNYAIYTEDEFARLWSMTMGDETPMPEVNFERDYVIGVFAGERATGGHSIEITDVTDENTVRTVAIALKSPAPGCAVTQALTSPYQFISVPFSGRELARTETEVEVTCN